MNLNAESDTKDIIRAVREKLSDPMKWAKGYNVDSDGRQCLAYAILNLTGVLNAESSLVADATLSRVSEALKFPTTSALVAFNDSNLTTHAVLLARLDAALA